MQRTWVQAARLYLAVTLHTPSILRSPRSVNHTQASWCRLAARRPHDDAPNMYRLTGLSIHTRWAHSCCHGHHCNQAQLHTTPRRMPARAHSSNAPASHYRQQGPLHTHVRHATTATSSSCTSHATPLHPGCGAASRQCVTPRPAPRRLASSAAGLSDGVSGTCTTGGRRGGVCKHEGSWASR